MSVILIVDDNEQNRYLLRLTLIASSHEVLEAANGVEALALARRARPDLIISDILMPQMDGFALCRECKRDEQLRAIPFVFYTATYADPRDEALALQLGAARFLFKPVENDQLISMVHEVLHAQESAQLTAPQAPQTEETTLYQLYNQALVRKLEDKMLELEQVNRTLAVSEERFRHLTETTSAAIFIFQDETIVYVNRACELLSGYSKAELLSMPFMQVVHPAHEDSVRQRILAQRQGKPTPTGFEFSFLHRDGSEHWVHFTGGPIEWNGKPAIIGSATDITERKRAEEEIRLLQTVARGIGEAEDLNGALAFVLRHVCETTGWVMGEAWVPSRDGARLECHPVWYSRAPGLEEFRQVSQSLVFTPGEGLPGAVWSAKKPLWIEDIGAAANFPRRTAVLNAGLKAAIGIPVLALGQAVLVMDFFLREPRAEDRRMVELIATVAAQVGLLIERKQAQDALRRSEEHFRVLIENASDIITVLDQDGTIRYGSPAVERVLGYRQQELMGTNTFELVHSDDLPRALDVFRHGLSHFGVVSEAVELRYRHKDGSWRMLEALGRSLVDESGQTIAVIHSRDITERKQRERELEAQAMLAQAVGETPELQPLLERLLLAARHAIPAAEKGSVLLVEPDGRLRIRALSGYSDPRLHHFYFAGDSGYAALTAREQKPLLITDARTDPAIRYDGDIEEAFNIQSAIAAPLVIQKRVIGVLTLDATRPAAFFDEELNLLTRFAASAALIIENASLFEDARRRVQELTAVHRTGQDLLHLRTPEELAQHLVHILENMLGYDYGGVLLIDPSRGVLTPFAVINQDREIEIMAADETHLAARETQIGQGITGWVAQHGQSVRLDDAPADPRYFALWENNRSELCVPIRVGDAILGVINVETTRSAAYSENDQRVLETVAAQIGVAIQNARLYQQAQQEIAERKRAEAALIESEHRYRSLFEGVPIGLYRTTPDGRILAANPALAEMLGYADPGALLEVNAADLFLDPDRRVRQKARLAQENVIHQDEIQLRRRDGRIIWARDTAHAVRDEVDGIHFAEGSLEDITERKRAANEIHQLNAVLEQRVAERTAELSETATRLQDANERLKELDQLKSQFIANVSHELRTPLTNIKTHLHLLERGKPERHAHYMTTLQSETDHLARLIADLLDISWLDQGRNRINLTDVDVNRVLVTLVDAREVLIRQAGLTLEVLPQPQLPPALADTNRLMQVLTNLIANAVNYTPAGGSIILSSALQQKDGRPWVTLTVGDTGPGITPEDQAHIFERFYRGAAARQRNIPGTGLGLAICREIMQRQGGQITLASQVGQGSAFTVWLPPAGAAAGQG